MPDLLRDLAIQALHPGACSGPGEWSAIRDLEPIASCSPADGEMIARVCPATDADYEAVIAAAEAAFQAWRTVPAPRRGELVRRIGIALREQQDRLGRLITLESGKIGAEARGEVQEMIDIADLAVGQSRMLYGQTMHSERPEHRMYEQWHPLGVVGVVTAFNFPVAVWSWNAFIAAVSGNTVVWKPSPKTPLCAIAVQAICNRVTAEMGHPGIFSLLVDAGPSMAERLAKDRRVSLLSFTGRTAVGRRLALWVAGRLAKSLLELSGNNAVILDDSADLALALPAIVFGAIGTAGQRCTTTRRLIVHESRFEETLARLRAAYGQIRIGDPQDPAVLMGPLIDTAAVQHYQAVLREAVEEGGEILYGGHALARPGFFVEPTLVRAENHWAFVQRETFAPILYVMRCRDLEEAIALNNAVPQGLSSALFTGDVRQAERFLSVLGSDCGIANVNIGTSGAEIGGAFGGEKDTGGGREAGSDAWKAYMRRQTNTINWGRGLPLAQGIRFDLDTDA